MPKRVESCRLRDFLAVQIRDVENVDDLIQVRTDFSNLQIKLEIK